MILKGEPWRQFKSKRDAVCAERNNSTCFVAALLWLLLSHTEGLFALYSENNHNNDNYMLVGPRGDVIAASEPCSTSGINLMMALERPSPYLVLSLAAALGAPPGRVFGLFLLLAFGEKQGEKCWRTSRPCDCRPVVVWQLRPGLLHSSHKADESGQRRGADRMGNFRGRLGNAKLYFFAHWCLWKGF